MNELIVIYYHDIVNSGDGYSYQRVEKNIFNEQMSYLQKNGYTSLLFEDLQKPLPEKAILITFDDGFRTVYENAMPIMRKFGMKGNIFLPAQYVEEENSHFMTWNMLKGLYDAGDFSVAGHTYSHVDIRNLSEKEMEFEIEKSNQLLKERLNIQTESFCMPYGKYDKRSMKSLRKHSQYKYIFASFYGIAKQNRLTKELIPRIGISNDDSLNVFEQKLRGKLNWKGIVQKSRLFIANCKGERITQYDIE